MNAFISINDTRFAASAAREGGEIVVRFQGNAEMNAERHLPDFLAAVHGAAVRDHVAHVRVDLTELAFMNSSCFKDFIVWLEKLRESPGERQYRVAFLSSAKQHWQRRSLQALSCFAKDHVTILPS